ncbi:MAG: acyl-CoA dehydrogenase family protein [Burkholderiaceae bacterium]|jgi:alkylation response protein AidB-like acyl-CoA dehydrogenase|nr:acyl-CoA dehydrogenase family protein [Burkholderiaceae bacterium]
MSTSLTAAQAGNTVTNFPVSKWRREDILASLPAQAQALRAQALQRERERLLPYDALDAVRQSGLGALLVPREWGGPGGTLEDAALAILTLAEGDSNVPHALRLHLNVAELWRVLPPDEFLRQQIDRILAGKLFGGASTERDTAKPGIITTRLIREGDHWRLNGRKYYSTGTAFADYASISAIDAQEQPVTVIIPTDREGLDVVEDWDGFGQRLTASGSLELNNVLVHDEEVRPGSSLDLGLPSRHVSAWRQLILVATAGGIVRALLREIQDYVHNKGRAALHSSAETAREDPFVQHVIGDVAAHSHAIDVLVLDAARQLERGAQAIRVKAADVEAIVLQGGLATAKTQLVVSKLAQYAGQQIFEAGGASATSSTLLLDRHWRNLRTIFSHNPLNHKARVVGDWHLNGVTTQFERGRVF